MLVISFKLSSDVIGVISIFNLSSEVFITLFVANISLQCLLDVPMSRVPSLYGLIAAPKMIKLDAGVILSICVDAYCPTVKLVDQKLISPPVCGDPAAIDPSPPNHVSASHSYTMRGEFPPESQPDPHLPRVVVGS